MSHSARRIALFGGTFDPIHQGHLAVAQAALGAVDEVLFIPANHSPLKPDAPLAGGEHRLVMAVLATLAHPAFRVVRWEIERPGPSYTVDTLRAARHLLAEAGAPAPALFWLVGADAVSEVALWHEPRLLFELARFLVIPREGFSEKQVRAHLLETAPWMPEEALTFLPMRPVDISSTNLRERLTRGEEVGRAIPQEVARYIRRYGLYPTHKEPAP